MFRPRLFAAVLLLTAWAAVPASAQVELYVKKASLLQTMLTARTKLDQWQAEQNVARQAVQVGPWYCVRLGAGQKFDAAEVSQRPVGPVLPAEATTERERPAKPALLGWTKCADAGATSPGLPDSTPDYVFTTINAAKPVSLSLELSRHEGFGGFAYRPPPSGAGVRPTDALVWLNGRQVELHNRLEGYERVPVAKRRGWHEAVLVDLPLDRGENRLVVALGKGRNSSTGFQPVRSWFNAVRLLSNPVPVLWAMIENDFPRSDNRLLEEVDFRWFDPANGWFSTTNAAGLEQQFVADAISSLGPRGRAIAERRDRLAKAERPSEGSSPSLCVTAAQLRAGLRELDCLEAAVKQLYIAFPGAYPGPRLLARIAELERTLLDGATTDLDPSDPRTAGLYRQIGDLKREALVTQNPLLAGKKLLFVKRYTYDSNHFYDEFNEGIRRFGGGLFTLSLSDGKVAPGRAPSAEWSCRMVAPELADGLVDRYDLSFDARRVVFNYKPPKPQGFRIYEIGIDGSGLRQLTFPPDDEPQRIATYSTCSWAELEKNPWRYGHWTDDMHPCYLPDGGIALSSTRSERGVLCGGHSLTVTNLHRIDGDGKGLCRLSEGALSEFCPTVMNDGRILYNRWEYVDKGAGAVQSLWAMFPDGSRSEEIYGNNITTPPVFNQPRHVPGCNHLVVCLGASHCPGNMGAILLIDLHKNKRTAEAMTVLTPGSLPKGNWGLRQFRNGRWLPDVYGPWYCDPFPLGDGAGGTVGSPGAGGTVGLPDSVVAGKFFLVSCNPDGLWNDPAGYGIYLLDVFGNRVPIYRDAEISCWQARPLEPRERPPVCVGSTEIPVPCISLNLPVSSSPLLPFSPSPPPATRHPPPATPATVVLSDVYQGLDGVPRGTVKYLRVMEQVPRPWSVYQGYQPNDSSPGQMVAVSLYAHLSVKVLHGVVPVHEDGSACFTVPAKRDLFFQALDKDFMEVQRMRTFVNFQPGEQRSCVGCHETRNRAPTSRPLAALAQPPACLVPQPGETAPRPLHYPTDVQPIFDRHCTACHNTKKADGGLDLSGDLTPLFCRSYEAIIHKDLVGYIQEFIGPKPEGADAMGYAAAVPPYTYGSHKSKLVSVLRAGHYDVKLPREEFIRLVTWVDANAPYYGSYFGRRNLAWRDRIDFRPVPTIESALGVSPAPQFPTRATGVPPVPPVPPGSTDKMPVPPADRDLPYPTFASFRDLMAGQAVATTRIVRISDPGTRETPNYTGFFFYQCQQFDPTGRYLLGMRVHCQNRNVKPTDRGEVGTIDLQDGNKWTAIGETTAWNWQQGARLQWRPGSHEILWNDRSDDGTHYVCRVYDFQTRTRRVLPRPVYIPSPDGAVALTHDFERMKHGGTYYVGIPDKYQGQQAPAETGIWKMDLNTGRAVLVASLDRLAGIVWPNGRPASGELYVFREGWNPSGTRFIAFLKDPQNKVDQAFSLSPDGAAIRPFYRNPSHHEWRDDQTVLDGSGYYLYSDDGSGTAKGRLFESKQNGHVSYLPGPGGDWIVSDTYAIDGYQYLFLYHIPSQRFVLLGKLKSTAPGGVYRVDLHPRASRDGRMLSIDSTHEGLGRQMYVLDIGAILDHPPRKASVKPR